MSFNSGINRVFLLGNIGREPVWRNLDGTRVMCFQLCTKEEIRKGNDMLQHLEWHSIKVPAEFIKDDSSFREGDTIYVQGKIQTRKIVENGVKLYKAEILATSIEHVRMSNVYIPVA